MSVNAAGSQWLQTKLGIKKTDEFVPFVYYVNLS